MMLSQQVDQPAHAGEEQSSGAFAQRSAHFANVQIGIIAARPKYDRHAQPLSAAPSTTTQAPAEYWSTSTSHEEFESESLSNLILANDWLRAGDIVHAGEKKGIALNDLISADDIIPIMRERAAKLAGEAADGYLNVTDTEKKILNGALRGWIALCCLPEFFGIQNVRSHTVTDLDLDAAARAVIGSAT